jgi:hypothetical protein
MRGLLVPQRSTEYARKTHQRVTSARDAIRLLAGADQLALNAGCGGLQRNKGNVLKGRAVHCLAEHGTSLAFTVELKVNRHRESKK